MNDKSYLKPRVKKADKAKKTFALYGKATPRGARYILKL
jgi:hypothetical protein